MTTRKRKEYRKREWGATGKRCSLCRLVKPLEEFGLHSAGSAGRARCCKPCATIEVRRRKYVAMCRKGREAEVLAHAEELKQRAAELEEIARRVRDGLDPIRF